MADETPVKRKEHDPILVVFGIILLLGCVLAVGIHINDHVINNTDATVTDSSTVSVNYTGSLYGYYDENGAMFQTTLKNIDENTSYKHIASYSYSSSTLSVNMSSWTGVQAFRDCLLGHHVGDTVRVCAPADKAYVAPETWGSYTSMTVTTANNYYVSSLSNILDMGWSYTHTFDAAKNMYLISYTMKEKDTCTSNADKDFATVTTTGFTYSGNTMTYTLTVSKEITVSGSTITQGGVTYQEVQGFHIIVGDNPGGVLVTGIHYTDGKADGFLTKATFQVTNAKLYFVITIVSIS